MTELQFNIGTRVHCADQTCGTLSKVIVNPETKQVDHIVIDLEGGLLEPTQRYVVPVDRVERATGQGVQLTLDKAALQAQVEYEEKEIEKPAPGWGEREAYRIEHRSFWPGLYGIRIGEPGVPIEEIEIQEGLEAEEQVIGRGTPVLHVLEELGMVDHLLVDRETGELSHVVIEESQTLGNYVVIPRARIENVHEDGIHVDVSADELATLPRYTPRDERELRLALEERLRLEAASYDLSNVEIEVDHGVVRLTGWVLDPEAKRYAEALALSTKGVIDVEDELKIGKGS